MKIYKYSKLILWISYILIYMIFIGIMAGILYTNGLISIEFLLTTGISIFYFTGIRKFIKSISEEIYAKGHLSEYSKNCLEFLKKESDNENIVPFKKIIIKGLGKNIEELNEKNKTIKVFLRKDDDFNVIKSQLSLIIGKYFLLNPSRNKLLDDSALESLRVLIAKKINFDQDILNKLNEMIKSKESDIKFNSWFKKWNKIDSLPNEIKPQKNILLEFIKPKFENISCDKDKSKEQKIEEINFLINMFYEDKIVILFIDDLIDIENKTKKGYINYYFHKAEKLTENKKYIILASRGRNNWINLDVAKKLEEKKFKSRYNTEKDKWLFREGNLVDVVWTILENKGTRP